MVYNLHFMFTFLFALSNVVQMGTSNYSENALVDQYPGYGTRWIYFPNGNEIPTVGYLEMPFKGGSAAIPESRDVKDSLIFHLYRREETDGTPVSLENLNSEFSKIDFSKDVKIIIHGWLSSGTSDTCQSIKDAYLQEDDVNVIILDWSEIAGNIFYPIPMSNTKAIGSHLAKFINSLTVIGGNVSKVHLIGHSLGAHVAGYAGKSVTKGKLARITGLDPALPGFSSGIVSQPLSYNDAEYVDVIHTCGGVLGFQKNIGHADFYPNGGKPPQPGCGGVAQVIEACSHGRSWKYFAESITGKTRFMAYRCDSWDDFIGNKCSKDFSYMGEQASPTARGTYYLFTEATAPFAKDEEADRGDNNISNK